MSLEYVAPSFNASGFNCPHCHAYTQQLWWHVYQTVPSGHFLETWASKFYLSKCVKCGEPSIWIDAAMVWPVIRTAPPAHSDMPEEIAKDFDEARSALATSPRSAAALLRLCVQKLCIYLGEPGKNINDDIGSLVAKGLSVHIQQALDFVRVVGNEQVHPGTLDVRDDPTIAAKLFSLVNFIVDDQISKPKAIAELYGMIPADKLKGIKDRDKTKS